MTYGVRERRKSVAKIKHQTIVSVAKSVAARGIGGGSSKSA